MLENLTRRLLAKELDDYSSELFVESVQTATDLSMIKRMSLIDECGTSCCNADDDLDRFKESLVNVDFPEDLSIDDRKTLLYNAANKSNNVLTEESYKEDETYKKISEQLQDLRRNYIDACKSNDEARKKLYIEQIKKFEKVKNDIKGGLINV